MLPHAIADARRLFGVEGAFYSDISNLNGFQAIEPDTVRNLSVGAQIALDFYRRVRYQPDEVFLRERALPVMTACAEFYQNLLELRGGVLQLRGGSTAFESYWNLEQNLVDQVLLRALFHALLTLNDAYALDLDAAGYQAVLDRLPPLQTESDFWLVPLLAQYNGYASATFETAAQCAARADVLDAALAAQRGVGPVFRLMGRTVKNALRKRKESAR